MTPQLMIMHHNTNFGNKMFGSLEDNIWTKTDIFTLNYDLGLEWGNKILSQDTLAYDDISTDQVSLQKSKQFMRYSRDKKINKN